MIKVNQLIFVKMPESDEVFKFLQKGDGGTFTSYHDWKEKKQKYSCSFNIIDKNKDNSLSISFPNQMDIEKQVGCFKDEEKYFLNVIKSARSINSAGENQVRVISLECKFKEFQNNILMITITNFKVNGI